MTAVVKYAEQTNNCEATRKYSVCRGELPKMEAIKTENIPFLHENCHLYRFSNNGM
jgi:hypothetical protein